MDPDNDDLEIWKRTFLSMVGFFVDVHVILWVYFRRLFWFGLTL